MSEESGSWMDTLSATVSSDEFISGRHGFELVADIKSEPDNPEDGTVIFESGFVYSTRRDAEQAGDDAAHAAWKWRCMNDD